MLALSNRIERLCDAGATIKMQPTRSIAYMQPSLCQVYWPRSKPLERVYVRTEGNASLRLEAGQLWDGQNWIAQPLPYGPKPRLILAYLTAQALKNKAPRVSVGRSMRDFMGALGLAVSGGNKGTITPVVNQLNALCACRLQLGWVKNLVPYTGPSASLIAGFDGWPDDWPESVELSDWFFEAISDSATPLDSRAIAALSRSSLDLDVYQWLAHRLRRVAAGRGLLLHWHQLADQFSPGQDRKRFKTQFKASLSRVRAVYPDAKLEVVRGGVRFHKSHPPIAPKIYVVK